MLEWEKGTKGGKRWENRAQQLTGYNGENIKGTVSDRAREIISSLRKKRENKGGSVTRRRWLRCVSLSDLCLCFPDNYSNQKLNQQVYFLKLWEEHNRINGMNAAGERLSSNVRDE